MSDNLIVQRAARRRDAHMKSTGSAKEEQHMADSYGRYDEQGGGFMMGLLTGTVLGAGLGMLLAPKAGAELRGVIGEQARNWGNAASEQYRHAREAAGPWMEKGREVVGHARDAVSQGAKDMHDAGSGTVYSTPGSSYGAGTGGTSGSKSDELKRS